MKIKLTFLNLAGWGYLLLNQGLINAQVVPDQTLPNNSFVTSRNNLLEILGGTAKGNNLFHSFQQFSVSAGKTAFFNNNLAIQNIFSRVTGNSVSHIDGLIKANGSANLFLLNPNGIIFGKNASLNIGGSFLATTANSIKFADGVQFSAADSQTPTLLTVSAPLGLVFANNQGTIRVQNSGNQFFRQRTVIFPVLIPNPPIEGLQVNSGKTLAIIGGDIILEGGILTAQDGNIELSSIGSGDVNINNELGKWSFDYSNVSEFNNISLSQLALVNSLGINPGKIQIRAQNLSLTDGSVIGIQNRGNQPSQELNIQVSDSVSITGTGINQNGIPNGIIRSAILSETLGNGVSSQITISSRQLVVENGGLIGTSTYSVGQSGDVIIDVSEAIKLKELAPFGGFSGIASQTVGLGKSGDVEISTKRLSIENGGGLGTASFTNAPGGDVNINATEKIQVQGTSLINPIFFANIVSLTTSTGDGGNIELSTPQLIVKDRGSVGSITFGTGKGGDVTINADLIELTGRPQSLTFSSLSAATINAGQAGNLTINTTKLKILDGATVLTSTLATGDAGKLTINASESIEVNGFSDASSSIESSAPLVSKEAQFFLSLPPLPTGKAGDISINTERLMITDRGTISVRNDGTNNAGTIQISAPLIWLDNTGSITATTESGEGGDITISSEDMRLRHNSSLTATAGGTGNGGNISINTDTLIALEDSDISANAFQGRGGNISINAQGVFLSPDSEITASSQLGIDGVVQINTPESNLQSALLPLNAQIIAPDDLLVGSCLARTRSAGSFVDSGTGGLPESPQSVVDDLPLMSVNSSSESSPASSQPTEMVWLTVKDYTPWQSGMPIIVANRIVQLPDGRIVAVAELPYQIVQATDLVCQ